MPKNKDTINFEPQLGSPDQARFLELLAKSVVSPNPRFLEVGSWHGDSTLVLGKVAKELGGLLFCVDWWRGSEGTKLSEMAVTEDVYSIFWKRVCGAGLEDVVIPIRTRSDIALSSLKDKQFDLVFIDGDHRYESVKSDISSSISLVRDKGILCGHDCEGKVSDYEVDFLHDGKDHDYYETVHCGVILAVGEPFNDYSVNHSIWSVKLNPDEGTWVPTEIDLQNIPNNRQVSPPPILTNDNYEIKRYGKYVYGIPASLSNKDVANEDVRNSEGVKKAKSFDQIKDIVGGEFKANSLPSLLFTYKKHNIIQFDNKYYALSHKAGAIDLSKTSHSTINKITSEGLLATSDDIDAVKNEIDTLTFNQFLTFEDEEFLDFNFAFYKNACYAFRKGITEDEIFEAILLNKTQIYFSTHRLYTDDSLASLKRNIKIDAIADQFTKINNLIERSSSRIRSSFIFRFFRKLGLFK